MFKGRGSRRGLGTPIYRLGYMAAQNEDDSFKANPLLSFERDKGLRGNDRAQDLLFSANNLIQFPMSAFDVR